MAAAIAAMGEAGRIGAQKRPGRAVVYTRAPAADRRRYDGTLPMRWLVLTLAAVLLVPAAALAQPAWVKAYEDGVEAFQKGDNDALAEQKLIDAREKGPKQSRRYNFSSVVFRPFIPDVYLGMIYARQGRYKQAQDLLEHAVSEGLVKSDDKIYAMATSSLQLARDKQSQLATNTRPNTPPDPVKPIVKPTVTPTNPPPDPIKPVTTTTNPPPTNVDPAWLAGFRRAMNASRASLQQARYSEARSSLAAATAAAGDAPRRQEAEALGREIDAALAIATQQVVNRARQAIQRKDATAATSELTALRELSPGHAAVPELTRGINSLVEGLDRTAKLANAERTGVKLFLSGQYKQAADILEQAVNQSLTSPRVHLFLASSRGAQALLAPEDQRPALVAAARRHYALAKPDAATLTADQRFISPSILKLLNGG
jgi:tetratricopeptide (TPR) repeat protein